jgi:hypothetical protein
MIDDTIQAALRQNSGVPFIDGLGVEAYSTYNPDNVLLGVGTTAGSVLSQNVISQTNGPVVDTRVRLRAMRGQEDSVYGEPAPNNILSILSHKDTSGTDGLLFPYSPQITVGQSVDYSQMNLTHSNSDIYAYRYTPSTSIEINAKFTVQNMREAQYSLAALHFLRSVSKMYFGQIDKDNGKAGLPPPVLMFSGYGNWMFDNLPVIVKNHSYTLDDHVDMVQFQIGGGTARLPSMFTISISLGIQQTPNRSRTVFSADKFRTGDLMRESAGKTGWI